MNISAPVYHYILTLHDIFGMNEMSLHRKINAAVLKVSERPAENWYSQVLKVAEIPGPTTGPNST